MLRIWSLHHKIYLPLSASRTQPSNRCQLQIRTEIRSDLVKCVNKSHDHDKLTHDYEE